MAAPIIYRSTDVGAPTMVGAPATLLDLLDQCLRTGYGGAVATGVLSAGGTPANNDQVVVGSITYTFKTALTPAANEVLINGSAANALINLARAINLNGTANTDYGTGTVRHPTVTATAITATTMTISARTPGTEGNGITTTETGANTNWAAASTSGGTQGKATGVLTSDTVNPANNGTVVLGNKTYTFKTVLTGAANEVLIDGGGDADKTLNNLSDAINAASGSGSGGGAGAEYGTGTVAHTQVTASVVAAHAITLTAIYFGTAPNAYATTATATHLTWGATTLTGGAGKDPVGWTRPYTGTNIAVYKQPAGSGFYIRVLDDGAPVSGATKGLEASVRAWEVKGDAADVDDASNDNPFPTIAQVTNPMYVRKSATSDTVNRSWYVIADDRTFYVFIGTGDVASTFYGLTFGDIYSYKASDGYKCMIIARSATGAAATGEQLGRIANGFVALASHYMARSFSAAGASIQVSKTGDSGKVQSNATTSQAMHGVIPFPIPADGGAYVAPVYVLEGTADIRGKMRGFWHLCHQAGFVDGDTFTAPAGSPYAGRSFLVIALAPAVVAVAAGSPFYLIETTAWDTGA